MNRLPSSGFSFSEAAPVFGSDRKAQFRRRFEWALHQCLKHGFTIEECFGMVWSEIQDEVRLTEAEEAELYSAMIQWAKQGVSSDRLPRPEIPGSVIQAAAPRGGAAAARA